MGFKGVYPSACSAGWFRPPTKPDLGVMPFKICTVHDSTGRFADVGCSGLYLCKFSATYSGHIQVRYCCTITKQLHTSDIYTGSLGGQVPNFRTKIKRLSGICPCKSRMMRVLDVLSGDPMLTYAIAFMSLGIHILIT